MNYRLAYAVGFHPWEDAANDPIFAGKFHELIDREEKNRSRPFGPALDIGTGSGIWGIELAKRGWQVIGVDNISKALDRARRRVQLACVTMQLVQGDVTAIRRTGIRAEFRLVLDTGTFHDFAPAQQQAMGKEIDAVTTSDASILLLVWPRRVRPLIRGASRAEIEAAFTNWKITHVEASHFQLPKLLQAILKPDEHWYRLTKK